MSGANGIKKFQETDRENRITLKSVGTSYHTPVYTTITGSTLTAANLIGDILLNAGSITPLTGPTANALWDAVQTEFRGEVGDNWTIQIQNSDAVPKVINLTGVTPSSITIPANTTAIVTLEVLAKPPAALFEMINVSGGSSLSFPIIAGTQDKDLLVYDATTSQWQPSSIKTTGQISTLEVDSLLRNNPTTSPIIMSPGINLNSSGSLGTLLDVPGDATLRVVRAAGFPVAATAATTDIYSQVKLEFQGQPATPNNVQLLLVWPNSVGETPPANFLRFIECRNAASALANDVVFRVDSEGNMSSLSSIVLSDQRHKKDIRSISLDDVDYNDIDLVEPVFYKFKTSTLEKAGFLAQNIEKILPEAVIKTDPEQLQIDPLAISALSVSLIKALKAKVDELTARVLAIESK